MEQNQIENQVVKKEVSEEKKKEILEKIQSKSFLIFIHIIFLELKDTVFEPKEALRKWKRNFYLSGKYSLRSKETIKALLSKEIPKLVNIKKEELQKLETDTFVNLLIFNLILVQYTS